MAYPGLAQIFSDSLAHKPFCTDNPESGVSILPKETAERHKYIQFNRPRLKTWMVKDFDRTDIDAFGCWEECGLPCPNICVRNKNNTKGHLFWMIQCEYQDALQVGVYTGPKAHRKPQRYLQAIDRAYTAKLGADEGFANWMCKNPLREDHYRVAWLHGNGYTLDGLAKYVDLSVVPKRAPGIGGRNCGLFHEVREIAYSLYRRNRYSREEWDRTVYHLLMQHNTFKPPLPMSNIRATARSISKWVWEEYWPGVARGRDGHGETRFHARDPVTGHYDPTGYLLLPPEVKTQRQSIAAYGTHKAQKAYSRAKYDQAVMQLRDQKGVHQPTPKDIAKMAKANKVKLSVATIYRIQGEISSQSLAQQAA